MRHSDYRATLKHHTLLGLTDTVSAIRRLPGVQTRPRTARHGHGRSFSEIGASDDPAGPGEGDLNHQQKHQPLQRESARSGATSCDAANPTTLATTTTKAL